MDQDDKERCIRKKSETASSSLCKQKCQLNVGTLGRDLV